MSNTALIWGASGGIGRALTLRLLRDGWRVLAVARDPLKLADVDVPSYAADVGRSADVAAAAHWAAQEAGDVALWVYAAGDILGQPLVETSELQWAKLMDANVTGAHRAVTHSLPLVGAGGHLVFVGAHVDRILLPKIGAYAAAKAALDAYVQVLAKELRDRRVTLVRPAAVDTSFWSRSPFRLPRGSRSAADVAADILRAHEGGHRGVLEL